MRKRAKKILSLLLAVVLVVGLVPMTTLAAELPFTDVSSSAWYRGAVEYAYQNGLFNGESATKFNPNGKMTRAMFVQVLANYTNNYDEEKYKTGPFTDVPAGKWYTSAVNWAADMGIVTGTGNNKFEPDSPVTREQMARIFYVYSVKTSNDFTFGMAKFNSFTDHNSVSKWARAAMQWATDKEVIKGSKEGSGYAIKPRDTATRGEVAQVFLNAKDILVKREVDKDIEIPKDPDETPDPGPGPGTGDKPTGGIDYSDVPAEDKWLFEGASTGDYQYSVYNHLRTYPAESPSTTRVSYTTPSGKTGTKYAAPSSFPVLQKEIIAADDAKREETLSRSTEAEKPEYLEALNKQEYFDIAKFIAKLDAQTSAQWGGIRFKVIKEGESDTVFPYASIKGGDLIGIADNESVGNNITRDYIVRYIPDRTMNDKMDSVANIYARVMEQYAAEYYCLFLFDTGLGLEYSIFAYGH